MEMNSTTSQHISTTRDGGSGFTHNIQDERREAAANGGRFVL
jgi:hypothetical protein